AHSRHALQSAGIFTFLGKHPDLLCSDINPHTLLRNLSQQIKAFLLHSLWQNRLIQHGFNVSDMRNPLWHDETEFIQNELPRVLWRRNDPRGKKDS
ncbi:hypothetical protein, partial [Acetobacter pasteurianus]|uniref:hypothetical protein n=1 Tax=Acetobacter pasteurianus TaxID=438 RepID=UPI001BE0A84A